MPPWLERLLIIGILVAGALAFSQRKEPFQAPLQTESCQYINAERAWFQDKLKAVQALLQEMSGGIHAIVNIKDENMRFQYANWEGNAALTTQLGGKCTEQNTSPECILLATPDSNIAKYAQLSGTDLLEVAQNRLNDLEVVLTDQLKRLNNQADLIGCPVTALSQFTKTFNTSKDIAYLDTTMLRDKLRELSPYYIDPALLTVLLSYLIDNPEFLRRVRTVPAQTGYVNDNIQTYWDITRGSASSRALTDYSSDILANTSNSFRQYDMTKAAAATNFACGIRSNASGGAYASLLTREPNPTVPGTTNYYWVNGRATLSEGNVTGHAFQHTSFSNKYN